MTSATAKTNVERVQDAYAGFNTGDIDTAVSLMAADIEWIEPEGFPYSGTYIGPDAVVENVFGPAFEDFEGFEVATDRFIDGGDTIVVLGMARGTSTKTGKPLEVPFAHVCDLDDGRMTRFVDYTNALKWQQALSA